MVAQRTRIKGRNIVISIVFLVFILQIGGCVLNSAHRAREKATVLAQGATTEEEIRKACQQYERARAIYEKEEDFGSVALMDELIAALLSSIDPVASGERYLRASELREKMGDTESAYTDIVAWYGLSVTEDRITGTDLEKVRRLADLSAKLEKEAEHIRWLQLIFRKTGDGRILDQLESVTKSESISRQTVEITLLRAIFHRGRGEAVASLAAFERAERQAAELPDKSLELDIMIESLPLGSCLAPSRTNERLLLITTLLASPDIDPSRIGSVILALQELSAFRWVRWSFSGISATWRDRILIRLPASEGRRTALALSSLLHRHDGSGAEFLEAARALLGEGDAPAQWLEVADVASHAGNYELVAELCQGPPFSRQDLDAEDLFRCRLLKGKCLLDAGNVSGARSDFSQAFTEYAANETVKSTLFLARLTELLHMCHSLGQLELAQQLFLRGGPHLSAVRDDLAIHGAYLAAGSRLFETLGDIGHALDLAHNHYGIIARNAGYEVKKSELYERIGDLTVKSGYVDQKFNPYELASSLTKNIDMPMLVPALPWKLAMSRVSDGVFDVPSVRDVLWTWFDESTLTTMGSDWIDEASVLKMYDLFVSGHVKDDAVALLDQFMRRKELHLALHGQLAETQPSLGAAEEVTTDLARLDRFILIQRIQPWLLETIRRSLRKAAWEQGNVKDMVSQWRAMEQRRDQLADGLSLEGISTGLSVMRQGRQLPRILKSVPTGKAIIVFCTLGDHGLCALFSHEGAILGNKVPLTIKTDDDSKSLPLDETLLRDMTSSFSDVLSAQKTPPKLFIVRDQAFPSFSIDQLPQPIRRLIVTDEPLPSVDAALSQLQRQ